MKSSKKIMLLTSCALALFALAACGSNQKQSKEKKEPSTVQKSSSDKERYKGTYSNLNSKASVEEVRTLLSAYLDRESVDKFLGLVTDYDSIVGSVGLTGDFSTFKKTDYNVGFLWWRFAGNHRSLGLLAGSRKMCIRDRSLLFGGFAKDAYQNIGDHLQNLSGALQAEGHDFCQ